MVGIRQWLLAGLLVCFGCLAASGTAGAQGGVDRSFGSHGLVHLEPHLPGYAYQSADQMAVGSRGGIYLLNTGTTCNHIVCTDDRYLTRRRPDGSRDGSFAGGYGAALVVGDLLVSDAEGRPLVASSGQDGFSIARFHPNGSLDASFGQAGRVMVPCACGYVSRLDIDRTGRTLAWGVTGGAFGYPGTTAPVKLKVMRLSSRGSLDRSFGSSGEAETTLPLEASFPSGFARDPNGSGVFAGSAGCCGDSEQHIYLARFGPSGGFDRGFAKKSVRAIAALNLPRAYRPQLVAGLILRPGGAVDVFGSTEEGGYILRVRRDGGLERGFGRGGFELFQHHIDAIAAIGRRVLVVGHSSFNNRPRVFSLKTNGGLDMTFGNGDGEVILKNWNHFQATLAMQSPSRALLFEPGYPGCRGYCPPRPQMLRLKVAAARPVHR